MTVYVHIVVWRCSGKCHAKVLSAIFSEVTQRTEVVSSHSKYT